MPNLDRARLAAAAYAVLLLPRGRPGLRRGAESHTRLLAWSPSGFSVHGEQVAREDDPERLERLARYVTEAPLAVDRVLAGGDPAGGGRGGVGASEGRDEGGRPTGEQTLVGDDADGEAEVGIDDVGIGDCGIDPSAA